MTMMMMMMMMIMMMMMMRDSNIQTTAGQEISAPVALVLDQKSTKNANVSYEIRWARHK